MTEQKARSTWLPPHAGHRVPRDRVVGSVAFALYAVTVRDASQIPLLAAGAAVCGIAFIALAAYALRATWRAGVDGRTGPRVRGRDRRRIAAIIGAGLRRRARSSCSCCRGRHRPADARTGPAGPLC
jgi:hypothetical protein